MGGWSFSWAGGKEVRRRRRRLLKACVFGVGAARVQE
jgi:hypothetical protein